MLLKEKQKPNSASESFSVSKLKNTAIFLVLLNDNEEIEIDNDV